MSEDCQYIPISWRLCNEVRAVEETSKWLTKCPGLRPTPTFVSADEVDAWALTHPEDRLMSPFMGAGEVDAWLLSKQHQMDEKRRVSVVVAASAVPTTGGGDDNHDVRSVGVPERDEAVPLVTDKQASTKRPETGVRGHHPVVAHGQQQHRPGGDSPPPKATRKLLFDHKGISVTAATPPHRTRREKIVSAQQAEPSPALAAHSASKRDASSRVVVATPSYYVADGVTTLGRALSNDVKNCSSIVSCAGHSAAPHSKGAKSGASRASIRRVPQTPRKVGQ